MELAVKGRMKVSIAHARWDISRLFVQVSIGITISREVILA